MIRFWRARLMRPNGEVNLTHPTWIISVPGGPVTNDTKEWQDYLESIRRKLRNSMQFVDSDFIETNFPAGYTIDLEIVEFNGYGIARFD